MRNERSELIREAFMDSIAVLGERACRALVEDLQRIGVFMHNISLDRLSAGLRDMLGDEAADIILQEVMLKLDKIYSSKMPQDNR